VFAMEVPFAAQSAEEAPLAAAVAAAAVAAARPSSYNAFVHVVRAMGLHPKLSDRIIIFAACLVYRLFSDVFSSPAASSLALLQYLAL